MKDICTVQHKYRNKIQNPSTLRLPSEAHVVNYFSHFLFIQPSNKQQPEYNSLFNQVRNIICCLWKQSPWPLKYMDLWNTSLYVSVSHWTFLFSEFNSSASSSLCNTRSSGDSKCFLNEAKASGRVKYSWVRVWHRPICGLDFCDK